MTMPLMQLLAALLCICSIGGVDAAKDTIYYAGILIPTWSVLDDVSFDLAGDVLRHMKLPSKAAYWASSADAWSHFKWLYEEYTTHVRNLHVLAKRPFFAALFGDYIAREQRGNIYTVNSNGRGY